MSLSDFMNELEEMAEEDSDNSRRMSGEDGYSYCGSSSSDESIDVEEQGKETIFRILSDDETLTKLDMGGETLSPWGVNDTAVFMFDDRSEITRLGVSIATNTHLVRFAFHASRKEFVNHRVGNSVPRSYYEAISRSIGCIHEKALSNSLIH